MLSGSEKVLYKGLSQFPSRALRRMEKWIEAGKPVTCSGAIVDDQGRG